MNVFEESRNIYCVEFYSANKPGIIRVNDWLFGWRGNGFLN